jgi:hypothetical protein
MRKIVSVVTFLVLFINLVIVINSIIIMMMDVMDLSHVFLHSKEGIYLCCLLFVSIYISYIIMKKEISTGNLVYFVIVQMFPFFIVFVLALIRKCGLFMNYESEEFVATILWTYIYPIAFFASLFIYYLSLKY